MLQIFLVFVIRIHCFIYISDLLFLYLTAEVTLQPSNVDLNTFFSFFRKNYKGYLLESRLHFRIHAIRLQLTGSDNDSLGSLDQDLELDPRPEDEDSNSSTAVNDDTSPSMSTKL